MSRSHGKITHSSLKQVLRIGIDSDFPGYPADIGLLLERSTSNPGSYLLIKTPKLSSLETGEMLDDSLSEDDLDTRLRLELLSMSVHCRTLAADLISHATRLESRAKDETLIYDSGIPESSLPGKNRANMEESKPGNVDSSSDLDLSLFT